MTKKTTLLNLNDALLKLDCSHLTINDIHQKLKFDGHANTLRNRLKKLNISYKQESSIYLALTEIIKEGDDLKNQSSETILEKLSKKGIHCHVNTLRHHLNKLGISFIQSRREESFILFDKIRQDPEIDNLTIDDIMKKYGVSDNREVVRIYLNKHSINYKHSKFMKKALQKGINILGEKAEAFLEDLKNDSNLHTLAFEPLFKKYGIKHQLTRPNVKFLLEKYNINYLIFSNSTEILFLENIKNINTQHMTLEEIQSHMNFHFLSASSFRKYIEKHNIPYLDNLSIEEARLIDTLIESKIKYTLKEITQKINYQGNSRWIRKYLIKNNYVFLHTVIDYEIKEALLTLNQNKIYSLKEIKDIVNYAGLEAFLVDFLNSTNIKYHK